jgi:hypothetical protein
MDACPKAPRKTSAEAPQRAFSRDRDRWPAKATFVATGITPLFSDCVDASIALNIVNRSLAALTASRSA